MTEMTREAELQSLCDRLARILDRTASALHGGPHPNGMWSFHDLPELVARLRAGDDPAGALDGGGYLKVLSNCDLWLRIAGVADADLLARLLDGQLNISVIFEHEFERRFPEACEAWRAKHGG